MADTSTGWQPLPDEKSGKKEKKKDKRAQLAAAVAGDPWLVEAWLDLVAEATRSGDAAASRAAFEALLKQFPTSTKHWIRYIELELAERAFDRVEALFNRCLRSIVAVDIWKFYLTYIQNVHSPAIVPPEKRAESRQIVLKAFDLVLVKHWARQGLGRRLARLSSGLSKYEEQQMMELQRKVYHKALSIPLANIEAIWKEYDLFENSLNKLTVSLGVYIFYFDSKCFRQRSFLSERSATYMTARTAFRELKIITAAIDALQPTWLPTPTKWTETDFEILRAWKKLIAWEKSNPLRIEDTSVLSSRWHDAARYLIELGKLEDASSLLHQAVEALPNSLLLSFALAELEESRKKEHSSVASIYETLITNLETWVSEINAKYDNEHATLMNLLRGSEVVDMSDWDGERREAEREKEKERNAEVEQKVEVARKRKLRQAKEAWSLAWVVYMRFARRSQVGILVSVFVSFEILIISKSVLAARNLFKRARKSELCLYHVYVAAAQMEYYSSKDVKIACNIFEAGMKAFADDEAIANYVVHYLDFLIQMNDDNNARALFERSLVLLPPENARELWAHFFRNEIENGDLSNILKVEKRMRDSYPGDADSALGVKHVGERWSYLDIRFVAREELGIKESIMPSLKDAKHSTTASEADSNKGFQMSSQGSIEHKDALCQPDLSKWTSYKPEARDKPLLTEKVLALPNPMPDVAAAPTKSASHHHHSHSQPTVKTQIQAPISFMIAESISQLLERLPPASSYNGPQLPLNEIIDSLKRLPLPTPVSTGRMVLFPPSLDSNDQRDNNRGSRGRSRRGGGPSGGKRKGGYGSDDDRHRKR
ncbi:hypothetical protein BDR26DRAFT_938303 [Obelidium mucronatum]|nr:hypothetical protein BDR26DRAFT_938303 [Obelidium mucronatum]